MAKDYNAINFKNKDVDKLSKKFGNGDPVKGVGPQNTSYYGSDYTKGRQSNFAGYDRKREPVVPETKPTTKTAGTVRGNTTVVKQNTTATASSKADNKTRLERKMEKYGVEPASSKLSPSQQKEFNKNRVKLAKEKERAAKPTPGRDKINDKVNKVLGRGKYDRGSMGKNMDMGGNRSKVNVDKAGQKKQDADCKAKRGSAKCVKPKSGGNYQWTVTK